MVISLGGHARPHSSLQASLHCKGALSGLINGRALLLLASRASHIPAY
jgi:hypothetical protein